MVEGILMGNAPRRMKIWPHVVFAFSASRVDMCETVPPGKRQYENVKLNKYFTRGGSSWDKNNGLWRPLSLLCSSIY